MSTKKQIIIAILLFITLLAGAVIWLGWSGSTKDIEAVANQFKPDSSWELAGSSITPPRTICLEGGCPSLGRVWKTGSVVDAEELQNILDKSGWSGINLGDRSCFDRLVAESNDLSCSADGEINQYAVQIYSDNNNNIYHAPTITLYISK